MPSMARTTDSGDMRVGRLANTSNSPVAEARLSMFAYMENTIRRTATDVADTPSTASAPPRYIRDPATCARVQSASSLPEAATAVRDNPSRPTTLRSIPAIISHADSVKSAFEAQNMAAGPATTPAEERYVR